MACHVVMVEARQEGSQGGEGQTLAYMAMVQANRKKRGQTNWIVYGMLSNGEQFSFYQLNQMGHLAARFLHAKRYLM